MGGPQRRSDGNTATTHHAEIQFPQNPFTDVCEPSFPTPFIYEFIPRMAGYFCPNQGLRCVFRLRKNAREKKPRFLDGKPPHPLQ